VELLVGEDAGRQAVLGALDRLAERADESSTVIIYFSGHGYRASTPIGEAYFLIPFGVQVERLKDTAISGSVFAARLQAIRSRKLLLLLDCCHAGGVGLAKGLGLAKSPLPPEALQILTQGKGRVIIASCKDSELSYGGKPYSAFTLALIEAFCGIGASKQDGFVRAADLAMYAREKVPARTKGRQHPILHFEEADNFEIAYYAGGETEPKGLPFAQEPEIEPEPGGWSGVFDQRGQIVHGPQANFAGDVHIDNLISQNFGKQSSHHCYHPPELPNTTDLQERGDPPPGSHLPLSPNAVFTSREMDLLELAKELHPSSTTGAGMTQRSVVITGGGGMGKTQLAVEFCYRYGRFFQNVNWIHADQEIPMEIAECGSAMGLPEWPNKVEDQVALTLMAWQDGGPHLVVFDNVTDPSIIQKWMHRLPRCKLLLTALQSQWPPDLDIKPRPLHTMPRDGSRDLLRKLAPRLKTVLDDELDDIAERLGDLPLALDLAGRYLADRQRLSPKEYLNDLEKAGSALGHSSFRDWVKHSPTNHKTNLAATFSMSWDRLCNDETDDMARQVFKACGYCASNTPIPLELLEKTIVSDDSSEMLDRAVMRLSELGLITPNDSGPSLHTLLSEFARLVDEKSADGLLRPLANAFIELAYGARKNGQPWMMIIPQKHLTPIYRFAKTAGLKEAKILEDFLPKLDFSRPENSGYLMII